MGEVEYRTSPASRFHSLVFSSSEIEDAQPSVHTAELFHDLFLNQVFDAAFGSLAARERTPYDHRAQDPDGAWRAETLEHMRRLFTSPAADVLLARQRQAVARDLAQDDVLPIMRGFQAAMVVMREGLDRAAKSSNGVEAQGWLMDAVQVYCSALEDLHAGLATATLRSEILRCLRSDLARYRDSAAFSALSQGVTQLRHELDGVRYAVRIEDDQVTVLRDPGAPDFSHEVEATFARFRQGEVRDHRSRLSEDEWMNHVEAQIVDRVALLHPEIFGRLDQFARQCTDFADPRWLRLDRDLPFYLLWLAHLERVAKAGGANCLPELVEGDGDISAIDAFDLALAGQAARADQTVVVNDFELRGAERMIVVTGPNHGGKTTLARVFGQLHYVASLGLPVAARQACLAFPDRILTHFERAEDVTTQRGKLQDDLVRMRLILQVASARSIVVMNEVFSSTSLDDAAWLGARMMDKLRNIGCRCLFVTFLDELAAFDADTVSMVALVDATDPTVRTYRIVRKPADGKAYARALADKYRVTRAWLLRRIMP